ncbi:MAG: hypothetical protein UW11_C0020G0008 [Parcubacteria group bacterium GW2011_GWA2_43_9b]|nr:MAG: hypothetical protein UW11_C0020G0008 [Parcubacteria group bacterium GW2011_GWA2_43_9b]
MSLKFYKIFFIAFLIIGGFLFWSAPNVLAKISGACCCNNGTILEYDIGPDNPCDNFCSDNGGVQANVSYDFDAGNPVCQEQTAATPPPASDGGGVIDDYASCADACISVDTGDFDSCEANCRDRFGGGSVQNANQPKLPVQNANQPKLFTGQGNARLPNFLGITDIKDLFLRIVNFLTLLAMPFAVLMLIWSGFLFVTAQGNDTKLVTARKNLIWTIAGIAIIVAANLIVGYIMEALGVSSSGSGSALLDKVEDVLNQIIGLLFILVTVYFFWGVAEFVRASATGGKGVEEGKKHMVWGIIGMTVMLGAWAIVQILQSFFK